MKQDIAFLEHHEPLFPAIGDWALLGEQRPRPELECNLPQLGIVHPVVPFAQRPYATCHNNRRRIGNTPLAHRVAQGFDPRIRVFGLLRVFGIRQPIMPARQPRVFIHNCRKIVRRLRIGPFPQRAKRPRRTDDRQVGHAIAARDFTQLIRHPRATGDTRDQPLGPLEHTMQNRLRAAHFPQDIDVDRALAI